MKSWYAIRVNGEWHALVIPTAEVTSGEHGSQGIGWEGPYESYRRAAQACEALNRY